MGLMSELLKSQKVTPELRLVYILISIGLVILAGLMSGLTLGLMSMDAVDLEVHGLYYTYHIVKKYIACLCRDVTHPTIKKFFSFVQEAYVIYGATFSFNGSPFP